MVAHVISTATRYESNMSRVRIVKELEEFCLNSSTASSPACDRSAQGISLSTPILMTTFGVVGNVLALIVLYSSRREAHARRTVFFVMLAGLAWTDLIGQFAVSPIAIMTYANNLQWVGGVELCRYHGFMMVSFGLVMPLIVCCMSVERLLAIKFSYYYAKHVTRRKAQFTFLGCWCATAVFAAMPCLGFGSYELQYPGTWCFLNFHKESTVDSIYAAFFSSFNILAILIMILCNFIVAGTLFRMRRSRQLHSSPYVDRRVSTSGAASSTSGTVVRARRNSDMEAQMIWFLCLITVAFSVCWLPLNVHILLMQFTGTTNRVLDLKVIRMASCNQILDPWLYVIFRKNSLLRIIRRLKACMRVVKQVPSHVHSKQPEMRYVISNKSYTFNPTSMGKTANGVQCYVNYPTVSRKIVNDEADKPCKNVCSHASTDSVAQLVSVCSCDSQCHSHSVCNPMAQTENISPFATNVQCFSYDFPDTTTSVEVDKCVSQKRIEENFGRRHASIGVSEPVLYVCTKSKRFSRKPSAAMDTSFSSDSCSGYYSVDSKHYTTIVSDKHSRKTILSSSKRHHSPFLGLSRSSRNSHKPLGYSQEILQQPHKLPNSQHGLHVPTSEAREELKFSRLEDMITNTCSVTCNHGCCLVSIPFDLDDIPESKTESQQVVHPRLESNSSSPLATSKQYIYKIINDKHHSPPDSVIRWHDSHVTRHFNGKPSDLPDKDHKCHDSMKQFSYPLKIRSAIFPYCRTNQQGKNCGRTSIASHCVDHTDHIKCFKARKTPQFLKKNETVPYIHGLRDGTDCQHSFLELSVGSCP